MAHLAAAGVVFVLLIACLWVRRRSWHVRWYRAVTIAVALQGAALAMITPEITGRASRALAHLTGTPHLRDYGAHVLFLAAGAALGYAVLCRLVPDERAERILRLGSGALGAVAVLMLLLLTSSVNADLSRNDILDVHPDGWLIAYWTVFLTALAFISSALIWLLRILRNDQPSRTPATLFIAANMTIIVNAVLVGAQVATRAFAADFLESLFTGPVLFTVAGAWVGWTQTPPPALKRLPSAQRPHPLTQPDFRPDE